MSGRKSCSKANILFSEHFVSYQTEKIKKNGLLPLLLDFKSSPDGGAVQHGESPLCTKLQELQLTFPLPSDSAVSLLGSEGCEGPPLLLE